jgi:hypothetical protein
MLWEICWCGPMNATLNPRDRIAIKAVEDSGGEVW